MLHFLYRKFDETGSLRLAHMMFLPYTFSYEVIFFSVSDPLLKFAGPPSNHPILVRFQTLYLTVTSAPFYRTSDKKIAHYAIVKMNDLYYFNDFPFPYLESIVLYYKKYKFKDTKLTNQ
ncbi:hypothetical protein AVEN_73298-1, partial [Araneus ventricosus]